MGFRAFVAIRIGMLNAPSPWRWVQENTGLCFAGWKLVWSQYTTILAAEGILGCVVTLFANPIEHGTERIARGGVANDTGQLGIVPGYAQGKVLSDFHES